MTSKFALVIANTEYQAASFAKLTAPGNDSEKFTDHEQAISRLNFRPRKSLRFKISLQVFYNKTVALTN